MVIILTKNKKLKIREKKWEKKWYDNLIIIIYIILPVKYIILYKICFIIKKILIKTYSVNVKYIIFRY